RTKKPASLRYPFFRRGGSRRLRFAVPVEAIGSPRPVNSPLRAMLETVNGFLQFCFEKVAD
ncbi:hypothetical protein, partial [Sphingomonas sp. T9W2]|uniref:hypothetical protein n=1 Tax=Sphingomonas sp. T9W2 TaxID=3143183 RepID=UPI0031F4DB1F